MQQFHFWLYIQRIKNSLDDIFVHGSIIYNRQKSRSNPSVQQHWVYILNTTELYT